MIFPRSIRAGLWSTLAAAAGVLPLASASRLQAQQATAVSVALVHGFTTTDVPMGGSAGPSGLIQGKDGNFYGTAASGGANGDGSIYRLTPAGVLTTLYSFSARASSGGNQDGAGPGGLIQGSDGNFYGTTSYYGPNGTGTFFRLTPAGTFTVLHSFGAIDGNDDNAEGTEAGGLVDGGDGSFYGVAAEGGPNDTGTVFKISTAGSVTVLHAFSAPPNASHGDYTNDDGRDPTSLIRGSDGNFYGTTFNGGPNDTGVVFRVTPAGALTVLHAFAPPNSYQDYSNPDGISPVSGLVQGRDSNFYGTTYQGGTNQEGTVYQLTPAGVFTLLHTFTAADVGGADAALSGTLGGALKLGNDGNFYGTIEYGGSAATGLLYQVTPGGVFTSLYTFGAATGETSAGLSTNTAGLYPGTRLLQGSDGAFYGSANAGGSTGSGTIYKLTVPGVHPSFFDGEAALTEGAYYLAFANGDPFGYYSYLADQHYLYHFDLGYEYVFDGYDGKDGVYLYDFKSGGFFYTSPVFPFPYLYDLSLNTVLYYFPDPGHAGRYNTNGIRYFYNFATGKVISK